MIHLVCIISMGFSLNLGAQELKLNPNEYTLLPKDEEKPDSNEIPLVYREEERVDETIIFENEPLVLRPEEENL